MYKFSPSPSPLLGIALCLPVIFSQVTFAQQKLALEEIIVVAQKRAESLQDVPISISAFSSEKLEVMGISDIEDIGANVPNLILNSFNNDANTVRLFIRGIGQNDVQLTQDPSVALYIDGVYVGTSIGSGIEAVDLQSIEVLRGPQGTLYGRNSTGGAVNLISKKPNIEELQFKQELTAGNFSAIKSKTILNIPIADVAAAKLTYLYSERDGFVENLGGPEPIDYGPDWGLEDRNAYRVDLRVEPTDNFSIDYGYDFSDIKDTSRYEQIRIAETGVPPLFVTLAQPLSTERLDAAAPARPIEDSDLEVSGHNLTLTWDVSDSLTLKSITGYREVDSNSFHDGTPSLSTLNGGAGSLSSTRRDTEFEQFTQEFQALGYAFDERLEYAVGLYYYDDDSTQDVPFAVSVFPRLQDFTTSATSSLAAYGQFTYTPTFADSRLHFTLGARYAEDDREAFRINENSATFAALGGPDVVVGANYDRSFENFDPSITIGFDAADDVNVYFKYVAGYKSGGTSQRSANPDLFAAGFDEETVDSYELGFKGTFLDSRLRANGAYFYQEIEGFQASVQTGETAGDRDFEPVDGPKIEGFELDLTALITDGLEVSMGFGYLDTELGVETIEILDSNGNLLINPVVEDIPYAPGKSFTAAIDYHFPVDAFSMDLHLGYAYQDGVTNSLNVFDDAPTDDRGIVDANLVFSDIDLGAGSLRVSLWGKNLTDQEYIIIDTASLQGFGVQSWSTFGDPRTYGLTLTYEYN